ncbi:CocE/NonD family hydrolase C-terminal non-catalytic domain-containing protein [uncultured Jatrophihabitans sp.]|uniref:CocE/NonD family hydrolase C-terminal non-catalytic domain-containing protein n=1 Tax=uncultured Jatrophihabitans sp. TaxID=1610747 RepID=UPI0035C9EF51
MGSDGTAALIKGLVAPVRVADPNATLQVTLPAIAHRFAPGHRVRIVLAGGDVNYRGGLVPTPVTVVGGSGQTLALPVVG